MGRAIAGRIGWRMLDTGIMYRALTWFSLREGIDLGNPAVLTVLAESVDMQIQPAPTHTPDTAPPTGPAETAMIAVNGCDATPHLRTPDVEAGVSIVAAVPGVREHMVARQRLEAERGAVVMVGRDIGTVVAPDARVKIYLDASSPVRAQRRAAELRAHGRAVSEHDVFQDLLRRDAMDARRASSPLRADASAQTIDTSNLSLAQVVDAALAIAREHLSLDAAPDAQTKPGA